MKNTSSNSPTPLEKLRMERTWPKGIPMPKAGPFRLGQKWTYEEVELLRQHYPQYGSRYCARLLGRTPDAIKLKADRMGIEQQPLWTEREVEYLKQEYGRHGKRSSRLIAAAIGRTRLSVTTKAIALGLTTPPKRWTDEELRLLNDHYGKMPVNELSKLIHRPPQAITSTAAKRGLGTRHTVLTPEQEAHIREFLGKKSMLKIATDIGITVNSVRTFADCIGYHSPEAIRTRYSRVPKAPEKAKSRSRKEWLPEEDATLRQLYPTHGAIYVSALLGRAAKATAERAHRLGVSASSLLRLWTPEELEILRAECQPHYVRKDFTDMAERLHRNVESVYSKVRRMGLIGGKK